MDAELKYTICFLRRGSDMLLLNRAKAPNMGLWNGVGGKIEPSETPLACVLREIEEETGIRLEHVLYKGRVMWRMGTVNHGGMHLFLGELPLDYCYETPRRTQEGILEFKSLSWALDPQNSGVVSNIRHFLPLMLGDPRCFEHQCRYSDLLKNGEQRLLEQVVSLAL